jgi:hypothetical protein
MVFITDPDTSPREQYTQPFAALVPHHVPSLAIESGQGHERVWAYRAIASTDSD